MKVNLGDIILIPLSNGWNAVAKVIFAPIGRYKTGISFIILGFTQNDNVNLDELRDKQALPIWYYRDSFIYQIFTDKYMLKKKEWTIIGNIPTTEEEDKFRIYQVAGDLYNNETEIGKITPDEYKNYTTLEGFGLGEVDTILVNTVADMLSKNELQIAE